MCPFFWHRIRGGAVSCGKALEVNNNTQKFYDPARSAEGCRRPVHRANSPQQWDPRIPSIPSSMCKTDTSALVVPRHCPERWTASESHRSTIEYDKDRDLGTNSKTITVNWRLNWASNTQMSPLDGGTRVLESNRQTLGDSTLAVFVLLLSCPNGNRFITSFYLPCSRASYYRLAFCPPVTASADVLVPSR